MYLTLTYLELDTFKQIFPTYAPAATTQWSLDVSSACYPLNFQEDILEIYHQLPRTFLYIIHGLLTLEKTVLEPGHCTLPKQAISLWYVCPETFTERVNAIDLEWPSPNRILKLGGQLLWSLITIILSRMESKIIFDWRKTDDSEKSLKFT